MIHITRRNKVKALPGQRTPKKFGTLWSAAAWRRFGMRAKE